MSEEDKELRTKKWHKAVKMAKGWEMD